MVFAASIVADAHKCSRFRLINAVLVTAPETTTVSRIANALGDIGHLCLASAAQNLLILWILSKVVSPGVSAFCTFAAVALVLDLVFSLTFFITVLSIDFRRLELQDSLEHINFQLTNMKSSPKESEEKPERKPWSVALLQGKLPFTTRLAGTVTIICFIAMLNFH